MVIEEDDGPGWRFTGVYGEARSDCKYKTWEKMAELHAQHIASMPWLCEGDFNEILFHHEKEGGPPRAQVCLDRFKCALELCGLHDLGFIGDVFT